MEAQQTTETKGPRINTQLLGITKDEIRRIDVSEAEVVRRQYLSHIREPQVTIRPDGVQFNNTAIQMLEGAVYIYLMVDQKRKWLVIREVEKDARDAQRWCTVKDGVRKSRKITGADFSERVYRLMGWNKGYYYKICGTPALPVEGEECLYLLFELENYDRYILTEKARKSAGVLDEEVGEEELEKIRAEAEAAKKAKEEAAASGLKPRKRKQQHPEDWDDASFGEPYAKHKNRLQMPKLNQPDDGQLTMDLFDNLLDKQKE